MSYLGDEFLIELTLCKDSICTSCWIIVRYLGGEFLMELTLSKGRILTSCRIIHFT